jgi:hypothetical protein
VSRNLVSGIDAENSFSNLALGHFHTPDQWFGVCFWPCAFFFSQFASLVEQTGAYDM